MTRIHVFPGQGSQFKGMGADLFRKYPDLVAQADEVLGYSIETLCLRDPQSQLAKTQFTQPALYVVTALAHLERLKRGDGPPDYVAGHSLGEFSALFAAGAYDFIGGLKLVKRRGELMGQAKDGAMAAVLGLPMEEVQSVLNAPGFESLVVANFNTATQIILSGAEDEIEAAAPAFEARQARYVRLNVSAAFHSPRMAVAQQQFADALAAIQLAPLKIPVISNYTARPYPRDGYADLMLQQLTHPVRWYESISALCQLPVAEFEEIGPGMVLTKIVMEIKKRPAAVEPLNASEPPPAVMAPVLPPEPEPQQPAEPPAVSLAVQIEWAPPPAAAPVPRSATPGVVFMFGGQGGQYHRMGEALYHGHVAYRDCFDACRSVAWPLIGADLAQILYRSHSRLVPLDRTLHSHPALFAVGLSACRALQSEGIEPQAVLGYSLGEVIAAVAAEALRLEEGMRLAVAQARLIEEQTPEVGSLMVLAPLAMLQQQEGLFEGCEVVSINYRSNVVLAGPPHLLEMAKARLKSSGVLSQMLPIRRGFHTAWIDGIQSDFMAAAEPLGLRTGKLPIVSCAEGGSTAREVSAQRLWEAVRRPVHFEPALLGLDALDDLRLVDLSPSGALGNFVKHATRGEAKVWGLMNQYGQDVQLLGLLRRDLAEPKAA